jgi:CRP-like cAMP-binding protein
VNRNGHDEYRHHGAPPGGDESCVFDDLDDEARESLGKIIEPRRYGPGETLLCQGDPALGLFVVRSGLVRTSHLTPGGKPVGVRIVAPFGILGLAEVVTGDPYLLSAETVGPCRIDHVARKRFVPFLLHHPRVAVELLIRVSQDVVALQAGVYEAAGGGNLGDRLVRQLQELAGSCGVPTDRGTLLDAPLTVRDLAGTLGCSRQWASKLLSEIEAQGLIEREGRRIILTDAALAVEGVAAF